MPVTGNGVLLDSTVVIHHFRRNNVITEKMFACEVLYLPSISLGELYHGAYKSNRTDENLKLLTDFLSYLKPSKSNLPLSENLQPALSPPLSHKTRSQAIRREWQRYWKNKTAWDWKSPVNSMWMAPIFPARRSKTLGNNNANYMGRRRHLQIAAKSLRWKLLMCMWRNATHFVPQDSAVATAVAWKKNKLQKCSFASNGVRAFVPTWSDYFKPPG